MTVMTVRTTTAQLPTMGANVAFATLSTHQQSTPATAPPHTRTDGHRNRPVIQSLSVNIATETGKKRYGEHQQRYTYINLIPGLWMDVSSVTSVYQSPCCRLHSPHPTFRILRGHSQGSEHSAPVTIMSSPGS